MTARTPEPTLARPKRAAAAQFPGTPDVPERIRGNAQRGAFQKGVDAGKKGKGKRANPYDPSAPTYLRGLHRLWEEGRKSVAGA